jgi:hypothetical protein
LSQERSESKDPTEYNLKVIEQWKKDLENQEAIVRARLKFAYNIYRKGAIHSKEPFIRELFEQSVLTQISLREIFDDIWGIVDFAQVTFEIKELLEKQISEIEAKIMTNLTKSAIKTAVQKMLMHGLLEHRNG